MSVVNTIDRESAGAAPNGGPKRRMIGDYILGKTQGEGTFGKVKSAVHQITQEKVAIKILEKERIIEVADVERVSREIHILKLIRHKHVIQLYEVIETHKHIFLIMEYADGGELFDYIVQNQKLDEVEACRFFQELISGIEYLHKLNIVHRDLKPENLLLDFSKSIKIIDFGLSNTYKSQEQLKTACGSPCYAAPEMIAGQRYNGLMVDIWSCGVILYAALCGCLPFEDQNTSALYKKILNGEYTIPSFISREGSSFLQGILTTDPKKRITVEQMKVHPWFNIYQREQKISPGIIIGYNRIPIDMNIISELESKGYSGDYVMKCLDANKQNNVTTAYFLLLKRQLINGIKSTADINSDNFDETLLEPKKRPEKPLISGIVNSTMLQLNKKNRSGSCQHENRAANQQIYQLLQSEQNPHNHRGASVPHVMEIHDVLRANNTTKARPQYQTLNPQHLGTFAQNYAAQLQSYKSIVEEDGRENKNFGKCHTAKMEGSRGQGQSKFMARGAREQQITNLLTSKNKRSTSYTTSTSKNSSVHGKKTLQTSKNGLSVSIDRVYLNDQKKSSQKYTTKDIIDMTQNKRNCQIYLDQFTDDAIQSVSGVRSVHPNTTKSRETRQMDPSQMLSKIQSMTKRKDSLNTRKSEGNGNLNQAFTFDRRSYLY